MTREDMIAVVDGEIGRLEHVRELLAKSHSERFTYPGEAPQVGTELKKRGLNLGAQRRTALAPKRRLAKQKREVPAAPESK